MKIKNQRSKIKGQKSKFKMSKNDFPIFSKIISEIFLTIKGTKKL